MCILEGQTMPFPGAPSLSLHEQHGIASLTSCRSCNEYMRWQRWWALMLTCCTYVPMGGRGFCAERAFPVHWASCHISWSLVMIGDRFSITWLLTTNPNVNVKTLLEGQVGVKTGDFILTIQLPTLDYVIYTANYLMTMLWQSPTPCDIVGILQKCLFSNSKNIGGAH